MADPSKYRKGKMYVRFPRYIGDWLRTKYVSEREYYAPIRLPEMVHPAGQILYKHLMPNPKMKSLSVRCISADMFNLDPEIAPEDIRVGLPTQKTKKEFVAISLPKPHFFLGRWITDDSWMQLGATDTFAFVKIIENEFWEDFDDFWEDYCLLCHIKKTKGNPVFYDAILDFMELFKIDIDNIDALYRALKRRKVDKLINK